MQVTPDQNTLGILHPEQGLRRFSLERTPPPGPEGFHSGSSLALVVDWFWCVRWNLPDGEVHAQQVLPHPNVNLALGTTGAEVAGIGTRVDTRTLRGGGVVVAAKFTPGGFTAVCPVPPASLVDQLLPLTALFPDAGSFIDSVNDLLEVDDVDGARTQLMAFLEEHLVLDDKRQADLRRLHEGLRVLHREETLTRVDQLAARMGLSVRGLQRLFAELVGLPAKTVLQRARLQDVAEHLKRGDDVRLADLAVELGYADQSHLHRDFADCFGQTPAAYLRQCREARESAAAAASPAMGTALLTAMATAAATAATATTSQD